jgi:hypothetical protein
MKLRKKYIPGAGKYETGYRKIHKDIQLRGQRL